MFKRLRQISQRVTNRLAKLSTWPQREREGVSEATRQRSKVRAQARNTLPGKSGVEPDDRARKMPQRARTEAIPTEQIRSERTRVERTRSERTRAGRSRPERTGLERTGPERAGPELEENDFRERKELEVASETNGKKRMAKLRRSAGQGVKTLSAKKSAKKDLAKASSAKPAAKKSAAKKAVPAKSKTTGAVKAKSSADGKSSAAKSVDKAPAAKPEASKTAAVKASRSDESNSKLKSAVKPAAAKGAAAPIAASPVSQKLGKADVPTPAPRPSMKSPAAGSNPTRGKAMPPNAEKFNNASEASIVETMTAPESEAAPVKLRQDPDPDRVAEKKKKKDDFKIDRNGDLVAQWEALREKTKLIKPLNYKMSESFEARIPIMHKVLGWGFVISNQNDRLEVLFKDGIRNLISNYKG